MDRRETLSVLITSFGQSTDRAEDMKLTLDVYEYALTGISDRNVTSSIMAFVQGRVTDRNNAFRPSPAELAEYARRFQMADDRLEEIRARVNGRIPESQALKLENQRSRIENDE